MAKTKTAPKQARRANVPKKSPASADAQAGTVAERKRATRLALCQELKSLAERAVASGLGIEACGICEHPIAVDTETQGHAVCDQCEAEIADCERPFESPRRRPAPL
jgi:hypothetical protein